MNLYAKRHRVGIPAHRNGRRQYNGRIYFLTSLMLVELRFRQPERFNSNAVGWVCQPTKPPKGRNNTT
ncbi:MAG: hypothetical protein J5680_06200 [Neisseriaceae bacterium]|nr:hypothetical protein [Neisseriaceae bacterium]